MSQLGHRCGVTRKVRFKSEAHARNRASEILCGTNPKADTFRAYHCVFCGGWHLTSKVFDSERRG